MNQDDLNKLLNLHELYLKHKAKGKCLELVNEDLSNLTFSNRDLSGSKFIVNLQENSEIFSFRDELHCD